MSSAWISGRASDDDPVTPALSPVLTEGSRLGAEIAEAAGRRVDLLRRRRGSVGTEAAVLDLDDDEELRMVGRSPGRVPGVVVPVAGLRRAGLAGDGGVEAVEHRERRSRRGVRGFVEPLLDRP